MQKETFSVPRIFALLPSKTEAAYTRFFQALKSLRGDLNPQFAMMDFEMAAKNAFSAEFPEAKVTFCLFHLSQNVYRHVVEPIRGHGANRRRLAPLYAAEDWNVQEQTLANMPRTNNNLEGYHNALQKNITQTHPSVWQLITGLQKEESLSMAKLTEFDRGVHQSRVTPVTRALQHLIQTYDSGDKIKFLRGCAHNLKLF